MKKQIVILLLFSLFSACSKIVEEVKETYPGGKTKRVITYQIKGDEKTIVEEKLFYENGNKELEGTFNKEGLRDGQWRYYYEQGVLWSEHHYKNGLRHGPAKVYYENGNLRYEGTFVSDTTYGTWKFYDIEGNLANEKKY
jgi:antitoxin component YwqK of YwqJK toxin-antitoxin module